MISGDLDILKRKGLLSDNNTIRASYKDAWITFSFLTSCKIYFKYRSITGFLSDHSPVFISYNEMKNMPIGPGFWKFNSLLLNNETSKSNLRDFIKNAKSKLNFHDTQLNWKLLKYKIQKFVISYSKAMAKTR